MTSTPAPTPEDALASFISAHARAALEHLGRIQHADEAALDLVLTVATVHELRTTLRRLRSVQRVLVSPPLAARSDRDLRALARALGELRDLDVLGEELTAQLDALPPGQVAGSVRHDLAAALSSRRRRALVPVTAIRSTPRWRRVVALLGHWQDAPPRSGAPELLGRLEDARAEALGRLRTAGGEPRALHSARRAAKRWRYAAEALLPAEPGAAVHHEEATVLHTRLGRLQDAVVADAFLDELLRGGELDPGSGPTLALLRERARRTIEEITAETLRRPRGTDGQLSSR